MAFLTKSPFPEFNEDQINHVINYMKSGKELELYVEGLLGSHYKSKYSIFEEYHNDLK